MPVVYIGVDPGLSGEENVADVKPRQAPAPRSCEHCGGFVNREWCDHCRRPHDFGHCRPCVDAPSCPEAEYVGRFCLFNPNSQRDE